MGLNELDCMDFEINKQRYYSLSTYLRARYGQRVQKIPLDAGFNCPNRDGTLSRTGCIFCNAQGSGSGLLEQGLGVREQYLFWQNRFVKRYKAKLFWAYFQSFSNTHGPIEKLQAVLAELDGLPGLVGLALGTRPDCLDQAKLSLLASQPFSDVWLELGLQSAHDQTLCLINRGHDSACFARAVQGAVQSGLQVCVHIILGLPGEDLAMVMQTIDFINGLPIAGIKFHNLYVCQGTVLAKWFLQGRYRPLTQEEYICWVALALARLRSNILVQRINGDPKPGELLAPDWAGRKAELLAAVDGYLAGHNLWQGKHCDQPLAIPLYSQLKAGIKHE